MIKTIIFDWGGVLIDDPMNGLITYCSNVLGVKVGNLQKEFLKYEEEFQQGIIAEDDLWRKICVELEVEIVSTESLWKDAVREVFVEKQEVWQLVADLKANGYQLGVLSNTEVPTMEYFYEKNYDKHFDEMIFSCREKVRKPGEKIYRIALDRLSKNASEVIFIDDNPINISGAKALGIKALVFKDIKQLKTKLKEIKINV